MTYRTLEKADGSSDTYTEHPPKPQPAYYALLPITVPLDIALSPFELVWLCFELKDVH
jgi:hypothetical protein